jgi:hypothetical protein
MALPNDAQPGQVGNRAVNRALPLSTFTVANAPPASENTGRMIYVSNGAAGQPCLAYSNGTSWLRILLGVAVAAS